MTNERNITLETDNVTCWPIGYGAVVSSWATEAEGKPIQQIIMIAIPDDHVGKHPAGTTLSLDKCASFIDRDAPVLALDFKNVEAIENHIIMCRKLIAGIHDRDVGGPYE